MMDTERFCEGFGSPFVEPAADRCMRLKAKFEFPHKVVPPSNHASRGLPFFRLHIPVVRDPVEDVFN